MSGSEVYGALTWLVSLLIVAFFLGDTVMYFRTPCDFRRRTWLFKLPGGGYAAWWRSRHGS